MAIPKPDDWARWCAEGVETFRTLAAMGPEMIELAKKPTTLPDGFGAGGGGPKVSGEAELTRPENAANVRAFPGTGSKDSDDPDQADTLTPTPAPDWVLANLGAAFRWAKEGKALAKRAERTFAVVAGRADSRVGRQQTSGGICGACKRSVSGGVDDRLRNGYCDACRKAWKRWRERWTDAGNPDMAADRLAFEQKRMAELSAPDDDQAATG